MTAWPASSISAPQIAGPWRPWREAVPTIVAESLAALDAAPPPLPAGRCTASEAAAFLARSALPMEAADPSPSWLLPRQRRAHARAVATLRRFGGAILADAVGTGKTYIALAAAQTLAGRATCIVPAALARQWRSVAGRVGIPVVVSSHERASRGFLPLRDGLVVIDESHHYRNPETRRYRHIAPWLAGSRALLVSATPLVNRLEDLVAQLALVVPDDVLAPLGTPSLAATARETSLPASLSQLVHVDAVPDHRPPAALRTAPSPEPDRSLVHGLATLTLSRSRPVARLIRGVLLRALASSPAAGAAALRRYRLLLLQARDAAGAGQAPSRAALRRWAGTFSEQTVLWELIGESGGEELALADIPILDRLIRTADLAAERPDAKAARLAGLLADRAPTLVFTVSRDTALWLRQWLEPAPGWCTGDASGIGHVRVPRASVLAAFAPGAASGGRPTTLIATDVAAEGLDLQGARRVVHYDLPWNPARLDQREGRVRRLGTLHRDVEIVTFEPSASIEQALRQLHILETKRRLTSAAHLADAALARLGMVTERIAAGAAARSGVAALASDGAAGALVGLALVQLDGERPWGTTLLWLPCGGPPEAGAAAVANHLERAASGRLPEICADPSDLRRLERDIAAPAAAMLQAANAARFSAALPASARRLVRRLAALGRWAARERDEPLLTAIDRALRVAARGHTAGEALLIEELGSAPDAELVERLAALPDRTPAAGFEVRVAGVVLFRSSSAPLP